MACDSHSSSHAEVISGSLTKVQAEQRSDLGGETQVHVFYRVMQIKSKETETQSAASGKSLLDAAICGHLCCKDSAANLAKGRKTDWR